METFIKIQNLKCGGCASTIVNNLKTIIDIQEVEVDVEMKEVKITHQSENTVTEAKQKLEKIGYPEEGSSNSVVTKAKSYVSCAIGKMNT
jgi:copper chaperone CopZ